MSERVFFGGHTGAGHTEPRSQCVECHPLTERELARDRQWAEAVEGILSDGPEGHSKTYMDIAIEALEFRHEPLAAQCLVTMRDRLRALEERMKGGAR